MKNTKNNFQDSIGNTPLIKLKAASEITGCNIYGKAEFLNPGGSVKDRAALALIKDAQEKKLISKGGIVVEGTAGNTGIGLGLLGNSLGYKTIIVMNDNQTQEKKDTLRNLGAELKLVPAKPYKDDNNFVKVAESLVSKGKLCVTTPLMIDGYDYEKEAGWNDQPYFKKVSEKPFDSWRENGKQYQHNFCVWEKTS